MSQPYPPIHVIGGGLAGCEAAFQIASKNIPVILHEMRPQRMTDAHQTQGLAELVCSNSFRSDDSTANAVGVLHEEMRQLGSLIIRCADQEKVPAGGALAVDRERFSAAVETVIAAHPLITIEREEVTTIPDSWDQVIVATGPLTSPGLAESIRAWGGEDDLAFLMRLRQLFILTASIPISFGFNHAMINQPMVVTAEDYINCPLNKPQYDNFIEALLTGEKMQFKEWEENTPISMVACR